MLKSRAAAYFHPQKHLLNEIKRFGTHKQAINPSSSNTYLNILGHNRNNSDPINIENFKEAHKLLSEKRRIYVLNNSHTASSRSFVSSPKSSNRSSEAKRFKQNSNVNKIYVREQQLLSSGKEKCLDMPSYLTSRARVNKATTKKLIENSLIVSNQKCANNLSMQSNQEILKQCIPLNEEVHPKLSTEIPGGIYSLARNPNKSQLLINHSYERSLNFDNTNDLHSNISLKGIYSSQPNVKLRPNDVSRDVLDLSFKQHENDLKENSNPDKLFETNKCSSNISQTNIQKNCSKNSNDRNQFQLKLKKILQTKAANIKISSKQFVSSKIRSISSINSVLRETEKLSSFDSYEKLDNKSGSFKRSHESFRIKPEIIKNNKNVQDTSQKNNSLSENSIDLQPSLKSYAQEVYANSNKGQPSNLLSQEGVHKYNLAHNNPLESKNMLTEIIEFNAEFTETEASEVIKVKNINNTSKEQGIKGSLTRKKSYMDDSKSRIKRAILLCEENQLPLNTCKRQSLIKKSAQETQKTHKKNSKSLGLDIIIKSKQINNYCAYPKEPSERNTSFIRNRKISISHNDLSLGSIINATAIDIVQLKEKQNISSNGFDCKNRLIEMNKENFRVHNCFPKTSLDYYRFVKVIGKGAFGVVYLATHLLTSKNVAIKSIDKKYMQNQYSKKKVLQEISILKQANHKNIIKLFEVFENSTKLFIVLEYASRGDLLAFVKERGKLNEESAKKVFFQITTGIKYCHENHILHRDIKLDNLILDENFIVKICDFGISRFIKEGEIMKEQCGTPAYIAPEILDKKGYEGYKSDIWSLGIVLYALVAGTFPFKANNFDEIQEAILNSSCSIPETLSPECQDIIKKMLDPEPKKRITMEDIFDHKWLKSVENLNKEEEILTASSFPSSQVVLSRNSMQIGSTENIQILKSIIKKLEVFGYTEEYIVQSLCQKIYNHAVACYFILFNEYIAK